MEKISVLMANYNKDKYISEAIESVLKQTYTNWELIIVDDGSTDNSRDIIKKFLPDKRIKLIELDKNYGCGMAKGTAANHATGEIMAEFDSDDLLKENALEVMAKEHKKNPNIGLIYSTHFNFSKDINSRVLATWVRELDKEKTHLHGPKASHFKTYKRSAYRETEGYSPYFLAAVDRDLVYKLEEVTESKFINQPLYYRRLHSSGISQGNSVSSAWDYDMIARYNAYIRRRKLNLPNISRQEISRKLFSTIIKNFKVREFKWVGKLALKAIDPRSFSTFAWADSHRDFSIL